jgi:hypothetical protein
MVQLHTTHKNIQKQNQLSTKVQGTLREMSEKPTIREHEKCQEN